MNFPAFRFFDRGQQLMRLQGYVTAQLRIETENEHVKFQSHPLITNKQEVPAYVEMVKAYLDKGCDREADIQLMFQMFFCRHADNFQIFLEEMVRDIAETQPELLEGVKIKGADKLDPAQRRAKRLDRVSRLSLRELGELLSSTIGFNLFTSTADAAIVERLFDIRNLITHNYGIADTMFLSRHPDFGLAEGEQLQFEPEDIGSAFQRLNEASGDIQKRAQARFGLWSSGA
ncbi:MAG TPA: hypothetical protein VEK57_17935 [Thermoanaerobaculia bacterium]|nr:hypothetical protein [Thermoanaerobaculia bacterium]